MVRAARSAVWGTLARLKAAAAGLLSVPGVRQDMFYLDKAVCWTL